MVVWGCLFVWLDGQRRSLVKPESRRRLDRRMILRDDQKFLVTNCILARASRIVVNLGNDRARRAFVGIFWHAWPPIRCFLVPHIRSVRITSENFWRATFTNAQNKCQKPNFMKAVILGNKHFCRNRYFSSTVKLSTPTTSSIRLLTISFIFDSTKHSNRTQTFEIQTCK